MKAIHKRAYALIVLALVSVVSIGASVSSIINPFSRLGTLGTSPYGRINAETLSDMTTMTDKAKEELWVHRVLAGADNLNVFSDNMIGNPGSGKPFVTYDDLTKVAGDTINVPTVAPLGGGGSQGEGDRVGNEEKMRIGSFPVKIGRQWFGVGITDVAKEQTVVGGQWDELVNLQLRQRLGRKKSEDLMMVLRGNATASNTIRPNFKASREQLKSADLIGTRVIEKSGLALSGLGGKPVKVGKGAQGDAIESFLFFGSQYGLHPLRSDSNYLEAQRHANDRGLSNPLFKGDYSDWDGYGIYRWLIRDHDAYGPVGSVIQPRAFLGTAITAADTGFTLNGGGSAAAAAVSPVPNFFEAFSNYSYVLTNGNVLGTSSTQRYLAIMNISGADAGKIGFYGYTVNAGGTITVSSRLRASAAGISVTTLGNITWNVAPWPAAGDGSTFAGLVDNHPEGSLIVEVNSYGVPFCFSFMLGEMAGICGHGSLSSGSGIANRTSEERNHGMDHGIGIECVFGSNVVTRTDGKQPNFVLVESAYQIDGFPEVV